MIPPAKAVTTTNCTTVNGVPTGTCNNSGGGAAAALPSQRKVFYDNGYWWIFWAQGTTIDYQYCQDTASPTACSSAGAWSTPATFTNAGNTNSANGQGFSAWLVGNDLVYTIAASTGTSKVYWGIAQLGAGSFVFLAQDQLFNFGAFSAHTGSAVPRINVAIDANNYLWISEADTLGGLYYMDVFECPVNVVSNPTGCESATWYTTFTMELVSVNNGILTNPTLLPLTNGGVNYMSLTYIDVASVAATGGPILTYVATSGAEVANSISWQSSCGGGATTNGPTSANACTTASAPTSQNSFNSGASDGYTYSAASSGASIYIVSPISGVATASISYTEGAAGYTGYDPWLGAVYTPAVSISGTNAVVTYMVQTNDYLWSVYFTFNSLANVASGVNGWSGATSLAQNTEIRSGLAVSIGRLLHGRVVQPDRGHLGQPGHQPSAQHTEDQVRSHLDEQRRNRELPSLGDDIDVRVRASCLVQLCRLRQELLHDNIHSLLPGRLHRERHLPLQELDRLPSSDKQHPVLHDYLREHADLSVYCRGEVVSPSREQLCLGRDGGVRDLVTGLPWLSTTTTSSRSHPFTRLRRRPSSPPGPPLSLPWGR